jgi:hypothetical protein
MSQNTRNPIQAADSTSDDTDSNEFTCKVLHGRHEMSTLVRSRPPVAAELTAIKFNIGKARALKPVRRALFFRQMFTETRRRVM